jgi:hypothetical protein
MDEGTSLGARSRLARFEERRISEAEIVRVAMTRKEARMYRETLIHTVGFVGGLAASRRKNADTYLARDLGEIAMRFEDAIDGSAEGEDALVREVETLREMVANEDRMRAELEATTRFLRKRVSVLEEKLGLEVPEAP